MKTHPTHRQKDQGTWISWLGAPAQFLALGQDTDNHYCLSRGKSPAGGSTPPHSHDFEEGFYLLSGELTFRAGNQTHSLKAGDFINIQSGVAHSVKNVSGEDAEVLIVCAPSGFDQFQIEGGYLLDGPNSPLVPFDEEGKARLLAAAQKYGINMEPSAQAFQEEPGVRITRQNQGVIVDVVGDRYRFLAEQQDTNGNYAIWEAELGPGGGPPPHIHRKEEEGFFLLEGRITFFTAEKSFTAAAGDFVHLPRNGLHWFKNETEQPARTLILVAPGGLEKMFVEVGVLASDPSRPILPPDAEEKERLVRLAPSFGIELKLDEGPTPP